jgi:hypothetical protein
VVVQERLAAKDGWIMDGDLGPYDVVEVRLRAADITPSDDAVRFSLLDNGAPTSWTPVAKDGADLPPYFSGASQAKLQFGAGETYDFEFVPKKAGSLELQVDFVMLHTTILISVIDTRPSPR